MGNRATPLVIQMAEINNNSLSKKHELAIHYELFNRFCSSTVFSRIKIKNSVIPFSFAYIILGSYKIDRQTARQILREWCRRGLITWISHSGIRILKGEKNE